MGAFTTITSSDGFQLGAYRAEAEGAARGGVVVIQEVFGVNQHIRDVADRYAAAGYLAVAPAIFDRIEPGIELGYEPADLQQGIEYAFQKLDFAKALQDVAAAAQVAGEAGKVGVVGYCFGGFVTAQCAINLPDSFAAASSYYGGGTPTLADQNPTVPMQMHYGALDPYIPVSDVEKLKAAWPQVDFHIYDADHGFNCDHRGSFAAVPAAIAQARTFRFFDEKLG
jgi:carboxymethylenebutenolidase